jgi:hypothetical protein
MQEAATAAKSFTADRRQTNHLLWNVGRLLTHNVLVLSFFGEVNLSLSFMVAGTTRRSVVF